LKEVEGGNPTDKNESCPWTTGDFPVEVGGANTEKESDTVEDREGVVWHTCVKTLSMKGRLGGWSVNWADNDELIKRDELLKEDAFGDERSAWAVLIDAWARTTVWGRCRSTWLPRFCLCKL